MKDASYEQSLRALAARPADEFTLEVSTPHLAITLVGAAATSSAAAVRTLSMLPGHEARVRTWLAPVRKRAGANPFAHMVTLGRAPNNDLLLEHPNVSKFHAYLRREGAAGFALVDANSLNGTWVNGERLAPERPVSLKDGDEVRLGEGVFLRYLEPPGLYRHLRCA
ncbi:MAG: FHA domain-containing protein [Planctomycetota bacterium]|nr:FHA domain-containing protein [Planctomycetota bacterium]